MLAQLALQTASEYKETTTRMYSDETSDLVTPGQPLVLSNGNVVVGSDRGPIFFAKESGGRIASSKGSNATLSRPAQLPKSKIVVVSAYASKVFFFHEDGAPITTFK